MCITSMKGGEKQLCKCEGSIKTKKSTTTGGNNHAFSPQFLELVLQCYEAPWHKQYALQAKKKKCTSMKESMGKPINHNKGEHGPHLDFWNEVTSSISAMKPMAFGRKITIVQV